MRTARPGVLTLVLLVLFSSITPVRAASLPDVDEAGYPQARVAFADGVTGLPELTYASLAGYRPLKLDLYLPPSHFEGPRPLVIYLHGGGWAVGTPRVAAVYRDWPQVLASLAARGYVVAAPSYRLSGEAHFPAAYEDVQASIRWLRANAARFALDPERVLLWGESAGGHLAALAAMRCDAATCVQGTVIWYGISDLVSEDFGEMDRHFLGCAGNDCAGIRQAASPVGQVTQRAPPFLIIHGTADTTVPYRQGQLLQQALQAQKVPVRLLTLDGIEHSFIGRTPEQTQKAASRALEATFAFIEEWATRPSP